MVHYHCERCGKVFTPYGKEDQQEITRCQQLGLETLCPGCLVSALEEEVLRMAMFMPLSDMLDN